MFPNFSIFAQVIVLYDAIYALYDTNNVRLGLPILTYSSTRHLNSTKPTLDGYIMYAIGHFRKYQSRLNISDWIELDIQLYIAHIAHAMIGLHDCNVALREKEKEVCHNFNTSGKGRSFKNCKCLHLCSTCHRKGHIAPDCTNTKVFDWMVWLAAACSPYNRKAVASRQIVVAHTYLIATQIAATHVLSSSIIMQNRQVAANPFAIRSILIQQIAVALSVLFSSVKQNWQVVAKSVATGSVLTQQIAAAPNISPSNIRQCWRSAVESIAAGSILISQIITNHRTAGYEGPFVRIRSPIIPLSSASPTRSPITSSQGYVLERFNAFISYYSFII